MPKQAWTWTTPRLAESARLARWGHFGTPVLVFPTAGGDCDEIERFHLIAALAPLIDQGRIKVYSVDGLCARAWLSAPAPAWDYLCLLAHYDSFVYEDVLPRIRADCQDPLIEPVLAGASRGAAMAIASLCRHPDSFRAAIGVSGIYDWAPCRGSPRESEDYPPLRWLHGLTTQQRERLRQRSIVLGSGEGHYEAPADSRHMAEVLGREAIPCRLSLWGLAREHSWSTWCEMLPRLLAESL